MVHLWLVNNLGMVRIGVIYNLGMVYIAMKITVSRHFRAPQGRHILIMGETSAQPTDFGCI